MKTGRWNNTRDFKKARERRKMKDKGKYEKRKIE